MANMDTQFVMGCVSAIHELVDANEKARANKYILEFAEYSRNLLRTSREKDIPLEDEITILHQYLSLIQLRLRTTFTTVVEVDPEVDLFDTTIPAQLVQTTINALTLEFDRLGMDLSELSISFQVMDDLLNVAIVAHPAIQHRSFQGIATADKLAGLRSDRSLTAVMSAYSDVTWEFKGANTGKNEGVTVRMSISPE